MAAAAASAASGDDDGVAEVEMDPMTTVATAIKAQFTCIICTQLMHEPVAMNCVQPKKKVRDGDAIVSPAGGGGGVCVVKTLHHQFCRVCLKLWFANNKSCPLCRGKQRGALVQVPGADETIALLARNMLTVAEKRVRCKMIQNNEKLEREYDLDQARIRREDEEEGARKEKEARDEEERMNAHSDDEYDEDYYSGDDDEEDDEEEEDSDDEEECGYSAVTQSRIKANAIDARRSSRLKRHAVVSKSVTTKQPTRKKTKRS